VGLPRRWANGANHMVKNPLPMRSILFTKQIAPERGICPPGAIIRFPNCGCTPATESNTHTAPSQQHAGEALHFHREVHVAGGINNIDAVLLIEAIPGSGRRRAP